MDARRRNHIDEIYLLDSAPLSDSRIEEPDGLEVVDAHSIKLPPNPLLLERLDAAELIIYTPGTQHSSLLPSYLTQGLGARIPDVSAVEIIGRALYYLRQRGARAPPTTRPSASH